MFYLMKSETYCVIAFYCMAEPVYEFVCDQFSSCELHLFQCVGWGNVDHARMMPSVVITYTSFCAALLTEE